MCTVRITLRLHVHKCLSSCNLESSFVHLKFAMDLTGLYCDKSY